MRDPQGREIVRTTTHMRAAFGSAIENTYVRTPEGGLLPPTFRMVEEVYLSGAGRRKAPAWTVTRKGGRA